MFCDDKAAQTFTAGLTGLLDTVDIQVMRRFDLDSGDLVVSIVGTNTLSNPGDPDEGDILASQTISSADVPAGNNDNVERVVFDDPPAVQAGKVYAIMVHSQCESGRQYVWHSVTLGMGDPYSGGAACSEGPGGGLICSSERDHVFSTYVTTPPSADVAVSVAGPSSARKGAQITYVVTVANTGPDTAHNVVLTNPVATGASFLGVTTTKGTCTPPSKQNATIRCALGDLGKGSNALSTISVKVTAKAGGNIANVVSAQSTADGSGTATPDPELSNNTASLSTSVTK